MFIERRSGDERNIEIVKHRGIIISIIPTTDRMFVPQFVSVQDN